MQFIDDWKRQFPKLWSVRLALISAALSAAEFALPYFAPDVRSGRFAVLAFTVSIAAAVARIVAQPSLTNE